MQTRERIVCFDDDLKYSIMRNFTYHIPTRILFGEGAVEKIADEILPFSNRVLIVYGSNRIKTSGLLEAITRKLESKGIFYQTFSGIKPNPTLESIHNGIDLIKKHELGFILAVGGGSVIDAVKGMAAGAAMDTDPWNFCMRKAVVKKALPIGSVLTLAATGSEMNGGSVISNTATGEKRAFGSEFTRPKFSVLDPTLTFSLPDNQTAAGVADIFTHVCEQYFEKVDTAMVQDRMSEALMKVCLEFGRTAIDEPQNYIARANLMWASSLALNGMLSLGKSGGDWSTHMIEHELSAMYDITHGLGLAIVLPRWMRHVLDETTEARFAMFAKNVFGIEKSSPYEQALAGIDATSNFFKVLGLESSLTEIGIDREFFDRMADQATVFGEIGGLKKLNRQNVKDILEMCL